MKRPNQIAHGLHGIVLAIVVFLLSLGRSTYGQTTGISLFLEQTPAKGGTITPSPGVHHFEPDQEITLTAVPKPGYRFVCWLGEVSDPTASSTVTYLSKSKIIIAVFEMTEYDPPPDELGLTRATGGGGSGAAQFTGGGFVEGANHTGLMIGGSGVRRYKPPAFAPLPQITHYTLPAQPPGTVMVESPQLEPPTQTEPAIPEPATAILLGLGGLFAFVRRGVRKQSS